MALSDLEPGKYEAFVDGRGVRENTRLPDQPLEAWARFKMADETRIEWSGFLLTKAGERNSKTFKCMKAMGCDGDVVEWLHNPIISDPVMITVVAKESKDGSKVYKNVDWVNAIAGSGNEAPTGSIIDKLVAANLGVMRGDDMPF